MKKVLFTGLFGLSFLLAHSQNVQSNNLATSGGQNAGTTTTGIGKNTFYGYQAGKVATTGFSNTFIGYDSGVLSSTGTYNTFLGYTAGAKNTTGGGNTFIGIDSGEWNGSGDGNTAIGMQSGPIKGNYNTNLGSESGYGSYGDQNTFLGYRSGTDAVGSYNLFLGIDAGREQTGNDIFIVENHRFFRAPLIRGEFETGKVGVAVSSFPSTAGSVDVSGYKFFVKGGILAEEIRVATTWADYVFEKEYKLPTLKEVEQHIAEKGHLINVPSAKEVEEDGISLGEIAKIQQEKIEELTLYIIEQNKINERQAEEIKEMKEFMLNLAAKK